MRQSSAGTASLIIVAATAIFVIYTKYQQQQGHWTTASVPVHNVASIHNAESNKDISVTIEETPKRPQQWSTLRQDVSEGGSVRQIKAPQNDGARVLMDISKSMYRENNM